MSPAAAVARTPADTAAPERRRRVLVVDDEPSLREMLRIVLTRDGYEVLIAESGQRALAILQEQPVDLLLSDIQMPGLSGVELVRVARQRDPGMVACMMTAYASAETAVEAMRLGAVDYFTKPFSMDELRLKVRQHLEARRLKQENVLLKRALDARHVFANIVGRSPAMLDVFGLIETVAPTNSTVLITGESGTGKELVAKAIHHNSPRRDHPFVALNCGAVPETLLESELFGHMRGAFTGADTNKKGLLEAAERGTVFLDEIGEMSATMQVKFLRVLQERRFRRVGGTEEVPVDVRVVAATHRDLPALVAEGRFREDLFYRIDVIALRLPPLRERRDDVVLLADMFLEKFATEMQRPVRTVSREAQALLTAYHWPGNVRELENVIERGVALERSPVLLPEALPPHIRGAVVPPTPITSSVSGSSFPPLSEGFNLEACGDELYRHYLAEALDKADGVQVKAAELLGMSFRSFRYYAKKFHLT